MDTFLREITLTWKYFSSISIFCSYRDIVTKNIKLPVAFSFSTVWINQLKTHQWYFSYFSQKTGFDICCKLSPLEPICMKCQNLFFVKNKKNISICHLLKILTRVLSVNNICPHFTWKRKNTICKKCWSLFSWKKITIISSVWCLLN